MICGGVVMLSVRDVARAVRFYIETLGMKLVAPDVIDAGGGFHIGFRQSPVTATSETQPAIVLYPKVPIEDAIAIFENRGVVFTKIDREKTTTAYFKDDDGHLFALASSPLSRAD